MIDRGTLIGLVAFVYLVCAQGLRWEFGPYIDFPSMCIVFGGVTAAALITYNPALVLKAFQVVRLTFKVRQDSRVALIKRLVEFAEIARRDGILALENVTGTIQDPFLVKGIQLAVDGTDPELIEKILNTELDNLEARHTEARKTLEVFKNNGPGYGSLGTVIGLILMLKSGADDPNKLTAGMATALITTFYGSMIANLVGPLCDKLANKHTEEMVLKQIMFDGVMSIQSGDNPRIVAAKLMIYLPPQERLIFEKEQESKSGKK